MLAGREEKRLFSQATSVEIRNRRNSRVKITCYFFVEKSCSAPGISLFCVYLKKVHHPYLLSRNFQNIFIQNLICTFACDARPADHTQKHSSE